MSTYRLDKLLSPASLALVGGSTRPGSLGAAVLRNIRAAMFGGPFGIVNPKHREIGGERTWASIDALPFVPDLIVVTAPAATVPGIVREAAKLGVASAVILSSGLGHGQGSAADAALAAARDGGVRLVGPNCLGLLLPGRNVNASFAAHMPGSGSLALISQSGAIVAAMVDWAAQRSVGFSGIVSIGDQIDVDIADCLDFYGADPQTRAILLYVEAIPDARKFMSAARAAARIKPVVVVKAGRMAQGAKAAATHTGALAGADAVYDAAFRRAGLLRVFDLRELFDCADVLSMAAEPRGRRLSILTNGGGLGILAVDRLVELGGIVAEIGSDGRARLEGALGRKWSGANPVDIGGDADAEAYRRALEVLLDDPDSDAVLVMNVQTAVADSVTIAGAVSDTVIAHRGHSATPKPVLAAFIGVDPSAAISLAAAAIPNLPTEDDAVRAFMYGVHHHDAMLALMATPPSISEPAGANRAAATRILEKAAAEGRKWLDPLEIAAVFDAYAIPVVPTRSASSADDAVAKADEFLRQGHSVAMKVLSPDIVHKSDVGGVVLHLADTEAVRRAYRTMMDRIAVACPKARISGVVIQPMIVRAEARELIAGLADDPTFGPIVVFGRGGIAVEIVGDKALGLPPLDMNLASDLVARTRIARELDGYRDVAAVKENAVQTVLVKLSQMAADLPLISGLDINPLIADSDGVLALDARIAVAAPRRLFAGHTRLAIRPYPTERRRDIVLADGSQIHLRAVKPEDEPAIVKLLRRTDAADIRLRFLGALKEFPHSFIAHLTQLDYARAMAFAAVSPQGEIIGVARMHSDSMYSMAEYAILVRSDMKGHGIGWALMAELIDYARDEGLRELHGEVLTCNDGMLQMCRELGFRVAVDKDDSTVSRVSLDLQKV